MNSPLSTSSSKPKIATRLFRHRWGFAAGLVLFVCINWVVARHYAYEQRQFPKPYETLNSFNVWKTANRDDAKFKVFIVGNSVHHRYLNIDQLEPRLEGAVGQDIQFYNLSIPANTVVDYRVLLSQLKTDETSLVVLPIHPFTFSDDYPTFGTDLDVLLAKPSVMKALGRDFYRQHVEPVQLTSSFLKQIFPVYRYRYLIKYDLREKWMPKIPVRGAREVIGAMTMDVARNEPLNVGLRRLDEGEVSGKALTFFNQLERILTSLEERGTPHFAYVMPTNLENRESYSETLDRIRQILRAHDTNWTEFGDLHKDEEFWDFVHPRFDTQQWALLGSLEEIGPTRVDRVAPSAVGLTQVEYSPLWIRREIEVGKPYWEAQPEPPWLRGHPFFEPFAFECWIGGEKADFVLKVGDPETPPISYGTFPETRRRKMGIPLAARAEDSPPEHVKVRYLAIDPSLGEADTQVEQIARTYELTLPRKLTAQQIKRLEWDGRLITRVNGKLSARNGLWWIDEGRFYVMLPYGQVPKPEEISLLIDSSQKEPDGPLTEALRRVVQTAEGKEGGIQPGDSTPSESDGSLR